MTSQTSYADQRVTEQAAFEHLDNVLSAPWTHPLEIEILQQPLSQQDELRIAVDGACIGIPKRLLALAFCHARLRLLRLRTTSDMDPLESIAMVLSVTQTMLLFDSEHISAANIRKRYLRSLLDDRFNARDALDGAIRKELWLLDSLMTSPLQRHSKSPTLWNHRRWLTEEFLEWIFDVQRLNVLGTKRMTLLYGSIPDFTEIMWRSFIEPELRIICKSGERHDKNYYAWDYGRKFMDVLSEYAIMNEACEDARIIVKSIAFVQSWCLMNLSDTSGWAFLLFLMGRTDQGVITRGFVEVGNLAISYKYAQDPIWMFVRTLLASQDYLDEAFRSTFVKELSMWIDQTRQGHGILSSNHDEQYYERTDQMQDSNYLLLVQKHLKWIRNNWQGQSSPKVMDDGDLAPLTELTQLSIST